MPAKNKQTKGEHAHEAKKPHHQAAAPKKGAAPTKKVMHFGDNKQVVAVMASLKKAAMRTPLEIKEEKGGLMVVTPQQELGGREFARTMLGTKPYRTILVQEFAASNGSVNTVYSTVFPADIAQAGDISSWLNLFDEMRMDSLEMRAIPYMGASGGSSAVQPLVYTCAFDPDQSTAVSSNSANLKATRHIGPCPVGNSNGVSLATGQYVLGAFVVSGRGHITLGSGHLEREVLPGSSGGVLAPNPVRGAWVPTTTASAVGGYYKWYAEAIGTNGYFGVRMYIFFTADFRIRG